MPSDAEQKLRKHCEGRLSGLRSYRYSWWTHWRELADYVLPRRYKWLITPNQQLRGSPLNQHIIDSTGTLAARNLASGMLSSISSPTRPWFKLKVGHNDSTMTTPTALWLAECERLMMLVFQESNFYNAMAVLYFDLVVFGTAAMVIYEDFENVITCYNPCAGEYYVENSSKFHVNVLYREFTMTISQVVSEFGEENCSESVRRQYREGSSNLSREIIVAHGVEPNDDPIMAVPRRFKWREMYWERGGSQGEQSRDGNYAHPFLRLRGYFEAPHVCPRWDLVSNDSYGRSPAMDALGDIKQLQTENRRKAQAIDKLVNPPMVADIQLKNQPASLLPGGVTYISGMVSQGRPGFAPVYQVAPPVKEIMEDLNEVRERIKRTFFNDLFQTISQFETRSNVSATEIDARRAESMVMLGPVLERIEFELLSPAIDRTFAIMSRAGILPPPPQDIQGRNIDIEYVSMLATAQAAAATSGIERTFQIAGNLAGIDPSVMDNIDIDYGINKYSSLMNNDPRLIRSPEMLANIRQQRAQQQAQQQQAEMAEKMAAGAKTLSETQVGGGKNALQQMTGAT